MAKVFLLLISLLHFTVFSQNIKKSKNNLKKKNLSVEIKNYENSEEEDETRSFKDEMAYVFIVKPIVFLAKAIAAEFFVQSILEKDSKHPYMKLTSSPYLDNLKGDYVYNSGTYKPVRFDISNQLLFNGKHIFGNHLNTKFRFLKRGSIEYNQTYLIENNKNQLEHLFMHDITANYYRVRTKSFTLHYGLGATFVHSGVHQAYLTYKIGTEYFFNKPVSLSIDHRGTLDVDNSIYQTDFSINTYKKNYALKAGVNLYKIGNINYKMLALGGKIYF